MAIHCCKDCYAQFDNVAAYFTHRRKKHPKFSCANCGKVFGLRKKFNNHSRVCLRYKKAHKPADDEPVKSLLDYKRQSVVTAEELDLQSKIYVDRKFGKQCVFRDEKMCKSCCKVFSIASEFADHMREHCDTVPLDATGVKSKFDFMKFMGLKIKEANDTTDCTDENAVEHNQRILANRITECKVVVIGERCKICDEPFKCVTDLNLHIKKQHSQHRRDKVAVTLRIGEEIISKILLSRRYIRPSGKTKSKLRRLKNDETNERYKALKYDSNLTVNGRKTEDVAWLRGESPTEDCTYNAERSCYWGLQKRCNKQSLAIRSEKEWGEVYSRDKMNGPNGNTIRFSDTRRNKFEEVGLDTVDKARNAMSLYDPGSRGEKGTYELEPREMYADEYYENMQFAEPWKDEILNDNLSWYSTAESESETRQRIDDEKDEGCFCIETIQPRLLPKIKSSAWEEEHFNMMNQDGHNYHEISLDGFTSIRNYSSDLKYQNVFSFPSDEESYDFQVQDLSVKKNSDDDGDGHGDDSYEVKKPAKIMSGYTGTIIAEEGRKNVNDNYSRTFAHPSEDESFDYPEHRILGTGKGALDPIANHPAVFIKEELILDDCSYCIDDDYSSSSNFSS